MVGEKSEKNFMLITVFPSENAMRGVILGKFVVK